jgi:hypothetical protein
LAHNIEWSNVKKQAIETSLFNYVNPDAND